MVTVLMTMVHAAAQSCSTCGTGEAPSRYVGHACNGHTTAALGVLIAYVDVGGTGSTQLWAVNDYAGLGGSHIDDVSLWGTDTAGADFCCTCSGAVDVYLEGSGQIDSFSLQHGARNLTHHDTDLHGYGLGDTLVSAADTAQDIRLHGDGGGDTLTGGDGGEYFFAGYGEDTCDGGGGDDAIFGGPDDDTVTAGGGSDYVDGGAGNDGIAGGADGDELYGGNGNDAVCSGSGTNDRVHGGPPSGGAAPTGTNDDQLWAKPGAITPGGSAVGNNANCGDTAAGFGVWNDVECGSSPCCTYNLTTRPAACPEP